jgi:MFS superfamily sulfate permease-like transporter
VELESASKVHSLTRQLVVRIRESLSFANTGQLKERLRRLELYGPKKSHPSDSPRRKDAKAVILHMGDVDEIDASALQILSELVTSYHERGVGIYFAHLKREHLDKFNLVGIPELVSLARTRTADPSSARTASTPTSARPCSRSRASALADA